MIYRINKYEKYRDTNFFIYVEAGNFYSNLDICWQNHRNSKNLNFW